MPSTSIRYLPLYGVHRRAGQGQRGVVLVVALIMLVVISLLATLSIRNATSTEAVAGAVRTTELATQAAEIALKHCEQSVESLMSVSGGGTATYATTVTLANILPYNSTPRWQSTSIWDSNANSAFVVPATLVNQAGLSSTYKRFPECMIEPIPVMLPGGTTTFTASFVITARGFGPEVPQVDAARSRPQGSEVWLQSHIEFQ